MFEDMEEEILKGGDFCTKIVGFWGGKKVNFCR
jgi:hypothetical protein